MIKQEIVEKISKYFKLTRFEAEKIYDDIFAGIIKGVKDENIADVTNLGEFIIKYNNNDDVNKKTVEFLPTLSLEEEINQRAFEESRNFIPGKMSEETESDTGPFKQNIISEPETVNSEENDKFINKTEENENLTVEEEIRKKREEILQKMTKPREEIKQPLNENSGINIPPVILPPVNEIKEEIFDSGNEISQKTEEINQKPEEILKPEDINKEVSETINNAADKNEQSFSDLFTEVSNKETVIQNELNQNIPVTPPVFDNPVTPPVDHVIPPSAVELHNQITGDHNKTNEYQTTITPPQTNGNGSGEGFEHKLQDNSYYIWYKDSEPNSTDTQTMSYEYELLYQATKEAEYKSKLRIYVTTFIMFFSIVLILLIFSPVIYKYFFNPAEEQGSEEVQPESSNTEEPGNTDQNTNQASVNSLESQPPVNNTQPNNTQPDNTQPNNTQPDNSQQNTTQQPVQNQTEQPKQETPKQETPKQETPKQETPKQETPKQEVPQNSGQTPQGVTKSSMGWIDDQNKVIYVQLENGKFTIQESAWDSDAKANKRISAVGGLVPGLKGSVLKVDLGSKGTWYRARFGEFTTLEEAKKKAEELRSKEKNRLQALLLTFLLYT